MSARRANPVLLIGDTCLAAAALAAPASGQARSEAAFSAHCAAAAMHAAMRQPIETAEWERLHQRHRVWETSAEQADPQQAPALYFDAYDRITEEAYTRVPAKTRGEAVLPAVERALQDIVAECDRTLDQGRAHE